jgi:hypothetical protein
VAETKITVPDDELLAEHRAGESQRALADRYGVALGTISRRITRAKRAEAEARKARDRDKAERRRRLAAANRAGQPKTTEIPLDSVEEARRLAARYPLSDPLPVATAENELEGRGGTQREAPNGEGYLFVLRGWPKPHNFNLCLDREALEAVAVSSERAVWLKHELLRTGWLIPGEPDGRERYGYRCDRLIRCPDQGRRRMFVIRGHEDLLQLKRTLRGLIYDQRYPEWGGFQLPDDGKARVRFIRL